MVEQTLGSGDGQPKQNPFSQISHTSLPRLYEAVKLPTMYDDSTHQLWRCDTDEGEMLLKLCSGANVEQSRFWQVMQSLFEVNLTEDLAEFDQIQLQVSRHARFHVPELVASGGQMDLHPAFILSRFVPGQMLQQHHLTDLMIKQLAEHMAGLHVQAKSQWGKLNQANKPAEAWPAELFKTFLRFSSTLSIGEPWLYRVMNQIEQIQPDSFSIIMADLRWDQFLFDGDNITTLVDLDAFVIGPRELELVLLEYQLNDHQAAVFSESYEQFLPMPDLTQVRSCYRLLLFLMNALGETNLDVWMQAPLKW